MKTTKLTFIIIAVLLFAACKSTQKSATTTSASPANKFIFLQPMEENRAPGNEELTAIHTQYKDITLDQLKEGYTIYTQGACIGCHGAKGISLFDEAQWKNIIDDMAPKANISDIQKDAIYKYVLAIKAKQPK